MTQFARPDSDVTTASWTSAPLYDKIDESVNDGQTITSDAVSAGGTSSCEVGLSDVSDPGQRTDFVIRITMAKSNTNRTLSGNFQLMQGATLIHSSGQANLSTTLTEYSFTVTASVANTITDFSNLRLQFYGTASGGIALTTALVIEKASIEFPDVHPIRVDQGNLGQYSVATAGTSHGLTTAATAAAGSMVFLFVSWGSGTTISSVSDGTLTWNEAISNTTLPRRAIYWAYAPAGLASGAGVTVAFSASTSSVTIAASSFLGVRSSGPVDTTNFVASNAAAWTGGTQNTTYAQDMLLSFAAQANNTTSTPDDLSVELHDFKLGSSRGTSVVYRHVNTTGSYTAGGTWSAATANPSLGIAVMGALPAGLIARRRPARGLIMR